MPRSDTQVLALLDAARRELYAGHGEQAADLLEQASAAVPEGDDDTRMIVEGILMGSAFLEPQLVARVAGRRSAEPRDPTAIRTPGERCWAVSQAVRGITLGRPRDEIRAAALAAAGDGGLADALGADAPPVNMALGALWWIDAHADVLAVADRTIALARRQGPERAIALGGIMRAAALQRLGDLPGAIETARAALGTVHEDREVDLASWLGSAVLVEALLDAGELEDAGRALEVQRGRRGARSLLADAFRHAEGRWRLASGDPDGALAIFEDCGERMRRWGVRTTPLAAWRLGKARALAALGRRDEALEVAAEDLQVSGPASDRARGMALAAVGEITGGGAGAERLRDAIGALRIAAARVEHARALIALGAVQRREGDERAARVTLREAAALGASCGARALVTAAEAELRASGARPRPADTALTHGEQRVAELAAAGRGNREIATELGVTIRTVETHLSRVYAKLSVKGRGELADALGARP